MKRMSLAIGLVSLGAGLCLAQDSSLVREPAVPLASIMAPAPKPRERCFGVGFRISALDKSSFVLLYRPHRRFNLELGGFGTRKRSGEINEYNYRFQAEADALLMPQETIRPFAGLRFSWEQYRSEEMQEAVYYNSYGYHGNYETATVRRLGFCIGADITSGRVGLQFGLTPLYDQLKRVTQHYRTYSDMYYYSYAGRDTAVTITESETVMEFTNFFVSFRCMF